MASNIAIVKDSIVKEVPAGSTAVLNCNSNDYAHNFMFWLVNKTKVIGPDNDFDERKYKYNVLSGKLKINNVSPSESGQYVCLSKHLDGSKISAGEVEMIVKGSTFSAIDAVKLVAIVVSIIVIIGCAVIYWRLRKQWRKYDGRTVVPVDEVEEEDGDEIYNRTTKAITPVAGPSRNVSSEHLLYGIDNQGLDTDFNSVFENIQIKTPSPSLI
ncbi:PREDICTED: uncharacterized protein LOC106100473 isoform X1 [Papilio polytes]|uniref:uncharacterized protein LOC106100473 isoform X1 n=2 Tax=Papilio polytes TaxID=76194 RepID=UPI0006768E82|nr:PREDICTED: uncharacterized protein LOC106100473 isoform X1 [Papilio polytes]